MDVEQRGVSEDVGEFLARLAERMARVVIVGQGYVGLPLAIRATEVGYRVVGFDTDAARIRELSAGRSYVGDVTGADLIAALGSGYVPACDPASMEGFDVAVITVPTPLLDGKPDLRAIEAAANALVDYARPGCCIVLESTTYPGTTSELVAPIIQKRSGLIAGKDYFLGYSPERVDPGNRTWNLLNTPKVVSGVNTASLEVVDAFYSSLVETTVRTGTCAEAEICKLLENTFRHVNIALVNELAVFADQLGVDIWRVIDAASTKPFGFMRFTPGPGVGGHCLPVDPSYLAWRIHEQTGRSFRFVELANEVNSAMPHYVVRRSDRLLSSRGKSLAGSRVLLLGLAYKRSTSDCRESPSMDVARLLRQEGATVEAVDPYVADTNLIEVGIPLLPFEIGVLASADLVLVLVDHPEFIPGFIAEHSALVLDTKRLLQGLEFQGESL